MPLPCSDADRSAGDSPIGSAAAFTSFLLLDYRSPWGRDAADDAVRDSTGPAVARYLGEAPNLRSFAIRPPLDRRGVPPAPPRCGTVGHDARMVALPTDFTVADLEKAFMTAPPALTASGAGAVDPVIGVCTNARRDRCCAVRGRPVALALHSRFGARVTEISHLSGHRFAATLLVLPAGYFYGFLDPDSAERVVRAALDGLVDPLDLRGRADLSPAAQAADAFWRKGIGPAPVGAVRITGEDEVDGGILISAEVQGTIDRRLVRYEPGERITETGCGGKPIQTGSWLVTGR